ncbi:MAG: KdsC family phosphatase [Planctomycetota bacterium]|jgi:YrbI family 3-deoxy-D-manno-octulosonate 8-phosphate phosphatase
MANDAARNAELLCLDVDGVLTDGGIRLDDNAVETKRFHVRDGTGIKLWMKLGYQVAIITGRTGQVVGHRARELGITHVIQGSRDKAASLQEVLRELSLAPEQVATIGDDLPDLPMMHLSGYPMAVADAVDEVRARAAFVTTLPGGCGAVREAVEHLIRARGRWDEVVGFFG